MLSDVTVAAGLRCRRAFMVRVLLSVVQFRINARYVEGKPPFIAIELDHSDSGREGCAVSTLTVTSEPKDWRGATQVRCSNLGAATRTMPPRNSYFTPHTASRATIALV